MTPESFTAWTVEQIHKSNAELAPLVAGIIRERHWPLGNFDDQVQAHISIDDCVLNAYCAQDLHERVWREL